MIAVVKHIKPWYLAIYLVLLSVLILSSMLEYRSRYRDLIQLIQDQAAMTASVIARSGTVQAELTEELHQAYIDRAVDLLIALDEIDAVRPLSPERINELITDESMFHFMLYDTRGIEIAAKKSDDPDLMQSKVPSSWASYQIEPILSGKEELVITRIEREKDTTLSESGYFIAIARGRGGVIACHLSVETMYDFQDLTGTEAALMALLQVKGLQYLQLSIGFREPYFVSKGDLSSLDGWERTPLDDILNRVSKDGVSLLEVVMPVMITSEFGEVRIGFSSEYLQNLNKQMILQIIIRSGLLTVLAILTVIFILTKQNTALLLAEKEKIEAEVYRLEHLNRLREKQAAMGQLAAGVAHEIRNPLNAIGILAQRLKREFEPVADEEEYISLTTTMVSEINRINGSLQDFLEYARPTPLKNTTVDLPSHLEEVAALYQPQAQEKNLSLQIRGIKHLEIKGDAHYLKQAFSNLIQNAIEACRENDEIIITISQDKTSAIVDIRDTGPGISISDINRIFDLYYTTKDMGTGVGLALTHKIIADHGGSIEVQSSPGEGSNFKIRLPIES